MGNLRMSPKRFEEAMKVMARIEEMILRPARRAKQTEGGGSVEVGDVPDHCPYCNKVIDLGAARIVPPHFQDIDDERHPDTRRRCPAGGIVLA